MQRRLIRNPLAHLAGTSLVLLAVLAGCTKSEPTGTVQGKVTLAGQPFSNARLNFISKTTGMASAADIEPDGSFKLATPLKAGPYTVFLAPKTVADPDHPTAGTGPDPNVPQAYWNESTSPLKVEIKAGPNEIPIDLK